jgi:hypothetical protein
VNWKALLNYMEGSSWFKKNAAIIGALLMGAIYHAEIEQTLVLWFGIDAAAAIQSTLGTALIAGSVALTWFKPKPPVPPGGSVVTS